MNGLPVGALTLFGGELNKVRVEDLHRRGWLACDGAAYRINDPRYSLLYARIRAHFGGDGETFRVPDLRGRFLRGTDHGRKKDPQAAERIPSAPGGSRGDQVGSAQPSATAQPENAFVLGNSGGHSHNAPHVPPDYHNTPASLGGCHAMPWTDSSQTTDSVGAHTHLLSQGGDKESRPENVYLHWFIRYFPFP